MWGIVPRVEDRIQFWPRCSKILLLSQVIHYERKSEIPKFHCSTRQLTTSENRKSPKSTAQRGSLLRAKIGNPQNQLLNVSAYYERKSEIPKFHCSTCQLTTSENQKSPNSTAQCVSLLRAKIRNPKILLLSQVIHYGRNSSNLNLHCICVRDSEKQPAEKSINCRESISAWIIWHISDRRIGSTRPMNT